MCARTLPTRVHSLFKLTSSYMHMYVYTLYYIMNICVCVCLLYTMLEVGVCVSAAKDKPSPAQRITRRMHTHIHTHIYNILINYQLIIAPPLPSTEGGATALAGPGTGAKPTQANQPTDRQQAGYTTGDGAGCALILWRASVCVCVCG